MTKKITHELMRHLDTLDVYVQLTTGEVVKAKGDRPTREGIYREAPAAAARIQDVVRSAEGKVWLYASTSGQYASSDDLIGVRSTPNRAGEGLTYVVENLAELGAMQLGEFEDPYIVLVPELSPMRRAKADDIALEAIKRKLKGEGAKKPAIEAAIVAYCAANQFADPTTESSDSIAGRYLQHIANSARHFNGLESGQEGAVLSMGHEPCLSLVLERLLGDRYQAIAAQGAVKTGDSIRFTMEQKAPGDVIQVRMQYHDVKHNYTIR